MRACGAARVSRRRGDGVQVLHQALEVGHLLGQLVRLVALGERNRVTAGGGGRAGGEGGKHLEGERERRRAREGRKEEGEEEEGQSGNLSQRTRGSRMAGGRGELGGRAERGAGVRGSETLRKPKHSEPKRSRWRQMVKNKQEPIEKEFDGGENRVKIKIEEINNKVIPVMGGGVC